jgi:hypothetical protein
VEYMYGIVTGTYSEDTTTVRDALRKWFPSIQTWSDGPWDLGLKTKCNASYV